MKKIYFLIIFAIALTASVSAQYKDGYYNLMNGKKKEQLKAAVKECVQSHTRLDYYDLPNNWRYTDVYPDLYDGNVRWWEMYSNKIMLIYPGQAPKSSFSANGMNREHSVPKSWWKYGGSVEYTPAYTDLWNLYPSDSQCNMAKNNYPFGEVQPGKATFDNGSALVGTPMPGQGGGSAFVFEPADEYKGDFARTMFYMACVYDDLNWTNYSYNMYSKNVWPTLKSWAYNMLLEWHRQDPVSQKEIDRNNAVETQQKNRNPFIDFPDLAEYIWGDLTTQTFYLSEQGEGQTPIPDESYLTQPVSDEALDFGQAAVGGTVNAYLEIKGMINGNLSLTLSGADRAMFTLGSTIVTPSQLNPTQTFLVPVTFTPTSLGEKTANILLYDGGLTGSIRVTLRGEGCSVPQLSRLTAYEPSEISETSYTANWSVAPEVVDYYVVTRVIYGNDGTETETLESSTTSLKIMRADNVMESYSVQSSRLGYLSEASNSITVAPYSGIFAPEATAPFEVTADSYGFTLSGGCDAVDVMVFDLSGRLVFSSPALATGTTVELPSGIYILKSSLLNLPFKILIP